MESEEITLYKQELDKKYKELYEYRLNKLQESNNQLFDENQRLNELLSKTRFRGII